MLVVKLESWPNHDNTVIEEIGRIEIINTGSSGDDLANFTFTIEESKGKRKIGHLRQYPARQGVWWLVLAVLKFTLEPPRRPLGTRVRRSVLRFIRRVRDWWRSFEED